MVVTMDFVSAGDTPQRRAQQDGYFRGQMSQVGALEEAPSLVEAIRRHDEAFDIPRTVEDQLQLEVDRLVRDLASNRFDAIAADGRIGRLTAGELSAAIAAFGRAIVPLPAGAWALVERYPPAPGEPASLDVPLWTAGDVRSDLTLSLSIVWSGGAPSVSIDDLHVL